MISDHGSVRLLNNHQLFKNSCYGSLKITLGAACAQKRDVRTMSGLPPIATIMRCGFTSLRFSSLGV
jgi:hypothetical protein